MRSDVQTILDRQAAPLNGNDGHSGEASLCPLPDLKERIDAFRLDPGLKAFQRKRKVAGLVKADLLARGKVIRSRDNDLFFFDATGKTLEPLDSEEFRTCLYERFGLNPTEDESRFVEQEIHTMAMTQGDRVEVHRLACWQEPTQTLYVSANDGTMFVLDGARITRADNGTDGVLFCTDRRAEPLQIESVDDHMPFHRIFDGLSLAGRKPEDSGHALALLKVWTVSLFFLEALPVRPILALVGEQGSGKTTLGRRIGLMLYGRHFEVGSFRTDATGEQDFLASITSRRFVVFDNADAHFRWLPDHLAKLATGAEVERRKLYTTNTLVSFRPSCFLMLTSRDPRWKRDDVAKRLLPIRMATIEGTKQPERQLQHAILQERPRILDALLNILNATVLELRQHRESFTSSHRLADFHWFGQLAARPLGLAETFHAAIMSLDSRQLDLLAEGDERLELLARWIDAKLEALIGETIISSDLFAKLRELHVGPERNFPFKGTAALGTWLGRHKDLIQAQLQVRVEQVFVGHVRGWSFTKTRCEDVKDQNHKENKGKCDVHTFTPLLAETAGGKVTPEEELLVDVD